MKNKKICQNPNPIDSDIVSALSLAPSNSSSTRDISAFDGDLLHKQDLRKFGLLPSDPKFLELIQNANQGSYIQQFCPDLLPPTPNPSPHLLGTIFEDNYNCSIVFRSKYIVRLDLGLI
jgi:hypothetical protein